MSMLSSLTREQRDAAWILPAGTMLEYFDLLLYVHMAVFLNELFFPPSDPHTSSLMAAFAFCSSYIMRPFGAIIFGWIGDGIGRKNTVIITTFMMFASCIVMANVPTYAEIGIYAAIVVTICRMVQGLSSMGEAIGAELYLTETIKGRAQYPCVAFVDVAAALGGLLALAVASLCTTLGFDWRIAFWFGAGVGGFGTLIRTRLRETPEFSDMQRRIKIAQETKDKKELKEIKKILETEENLGTPKEQRKTALLHFLLQCNGPLFFYFTYVYCGGILKKFGLTTEEIIHQNLIVSFLVLIYGIILAFLSHKIYPLKILKVKWVFSLLFVLICPFWLYHIHTASGILMLQCLAMFRVISSPAVPIFLRNYPVLKRFTYATFTFACARTLMAVIPAFGLVYLTDVFGYWGIWFLFIPSILVFGLAILHFEKLERKRGNYPDSEKPIEVVQAAA